MRAKYWILLFAVIFCLVGCRDQTEIPVHTEPTLPQFNEQSTPQKLLQAAVDGLKGKNFAYSYGSGLQGEWKLTTAEDANALRELVPNEDFISEFCAMPLMAIPSNDGTFCYQVTDLMPDQICRLICGRELTEEEQQTLSDYPDAKGTVQIKVDSEGIFQSLQVDITLSDKVWTLQIVRE